MPAGEVRSTVIEPPAAVAASRTRARPTNLRLHSVRADPPPSRPVRRGDPLFAC